MTARHRVPQPEAVSGPGQELWPATPAGGGLASGTAHGGLDLPDLPAQDEPAASSTRTFGLTRPRSIRTRLARILALSLTIVLLLLGIMVLQQLTAYRSASATAGTVGLTLKVQDAIHLLQRERGLSNGLLGGEERFRTQVLNTRTQTDAALAALDRVLNSRHDADAGRVRDALGKLTDLATVRANVDGGQADRAATFGFYTDAIAAMNRLDLGLNQAQDPDLRHGLQALYALGTMKEYTGQERGFLNGVLAAGTFHQGEYQKFADIRGGKNSGLAEFDRFATPDQRGRLEAALRTSAATQASLTEAVAVAAPAGTFARHVDPVRWWAQMTSVIDQMRTVQQSVGADITARAEALKATGTRSLTTFLLLAALAVAAEVFLVVGASRSIIGPLGALAREADDVATRRLPDAVAALQTADEEYRPHVAPVAAPPNAGTEIRSVALALDRVQSTALALAGEQAVIRRNTTESLANLGRRNQNLVRRQLALISEFERDELDPSALANMFELDHLATRMRRNAESLLVLVGLTSPRPWSEPLSVTDVIRAGLSEVEEYRRVVLRRVDEALIVGSAVTEVAHMLAELIENGLAFSPPDVEVEVYGRRVGPRYLLVMVDQGVGMSPQMLARANARLRGAEDFILAPTRFLGHYVVGRLATRLRAEVELSTSPVTGVTARVLLPADLLADQSAAPGGASQNGTSGVPGAGKARPAAARPAGEPPAERPARPAQPAAERAPAAPPPALPPTVPSYGTAHRPLRASTRQGALGREDGRPGAAPPPAVATPPAATPPAATPPAATPPAGTTVPPAPAAPSPAMPMAPTPPAAAFRSRPPAAPAPAAGQPGATRPATGAQPAAPATRPAVGGERTRNGLVKRVPAGGRAAAGPAGRPAAVHPPAAGHPPAASNPPPPVGPERSPEEVRLMLSAFRTGHQRGQSQPRPTGPRQSPPPQPNQAP